MLKNLFIICLLIMAGVQTYTYFQKEENRPVFLTQIINSRSSAAADRERLSPDTGGGTVDPEKFAAVISENPVAVWGSGIKTLNIHTGFDPAKYVVRGVPNIIELCTWRCSACRLERKLLKEFSKIRPDVAIRIIMIPQKWNFYLMKEKYGVEMVHTPHTYVYDAQGNLVVEDRRRKSAGGDYVSEWMSQSFEQAGINVLPIIQKFI